MNLTNQDAAILYPQFMYEALLKYASKNDTLQFKVRSTPYPKNRQIQDRKNGFDATKVAFVSSLAYAIALTTTIGSLVEERTTHLKHMQVISGVSLLGYWTAYFFIDLIKLQLISGFAALMF